MSTKQKKWFRSAFADENIESPSKRSRSSPTNDENESPQSIENNTKISHKSLTNYNSSNWIEHFAPKTISDLAVHPKKIAEVQDWIKHCEAIRKKYPGQILLVTGPSGSGKTATVKTVARENKYELVEWVTPVDIEFSNNNEFEYQTNWESQAEVFRQFLFKSSRYKSLFENLEKRLILVEDFPNVFINNPSGFSELLENYKVYGKSPLVFIVADSRRKNLNLAHNLFPETIQSQLQIMHISFNPASSTLMKSALKRITSFMTKEGFNKFYQIPNQTVIDSINVAAQGDIRNAVINLHFASQKGAPSLETEPSPNQSLSRVTSKAKKLKTIGRDETITMMHALGRVFNPKYIENSEPKKFLHIPESIADAFSSEPKLFVDLIHSNYLGHFEDIKSVMGAIDSISQSDVLMGEYRDDIVIQRGLNIATRGLMVYNLKPVTGWMPIKGSRKQNLRNVEDELRKLGVQNELSKNVLASDYRTYVNIINSSGLTK